MATTNTPRFDIFSDTFKEVNGFRPRGSIASRFLTSTPEEQDAEIEGLQADVNAELAWKEEERSHFRYHHAEDVSWGDLFGEMLEIGPEDREGRAH